MGYYVNMHAWLERVEQRHAPDWPMQCIAMQCNAMGCNAMQCNAMQCNAMQCNAMQCNAMQYKLFTDFLYLQVLHTYSKMKTILILGDESTFLER